MTAFRSGAEGDSDLQVVWEDGERVFYRTARAGADERRDNDASRWPGGEPKVVANIPPSNAQRRMARILVLVLLAILAATWPFATIKLPEIDAFVPSLATANSPEGEAPSFSAFSSACHPP